MPSVQDAIQALLKTAVQQNPEPGKGKRVPVIAISREHGALGRQIADALGKKLNLPVYDREILDRVAERLNTDPETVRMLDESIARARDMWLVRLFSGKDLSEDTYRTHVVNVILSLARTGGLLLGRGSHVVLSTSCALRVRITASPDVCAKRVCDRYGHNLDEARERIQAVNHARGRFVWELFHQRNSDPTNFDLVVNTDRLTSIDDVVTMLVSAYTAIEASRDEVDALAGAE